MNTQEALKIVGGLSKPSKMPGWAYGLPAAECKTGSKLAQQDNTTCSGCYALKGCLRVSGGPGCTVQKTGGHPSPAMGWSNGTINKF